MNLKHFLFGIIGLLIAVPAPTENPYSPDTPESGSVEAIAHDTTEPRYGSSWVAYVPESSSVSSPKDFLGHIAGAAGELVRSDKIYAYFRELARTSKRVHVEVIGKSEEGREILLAAIADEAGILNLDQLREASAKLADPRITPPEQAEKVISNARPMYYLNGAIHADESVSPDMLLELAYRLAVSEQPMIRRIREKTVVLINPVSNPDGRDKMADWFYRYLKGKTDYDSLPRQSPPYWGKYVYVDANRDAHQLTTGTMQAIQKMFFKYHPVVVHDLHEAIPLLQTWNGTGPYNPNLEPSVLGEFLEMSFHEMSTMSALGMPGVWTWNFGEGFGHHYVDSVGMNHNAVGRGYETFGNTTAETVTRKLDPEDVTREWYRPWPPPERTFKWSHRDGVNYSETGCLAAIDYTARQSEQMLRNFYQRGYSSWKKGKDGNPYAFVIRAEQQDRRMVAQMINRLMNQGIEVSRATRDFQVKEGKFPTGTYLVRLDQPYRNYAVDILMPQAFPENTEHPPYDDTSWAISVQFGVEAIPIADGTVVNVPLERIKTQIFPEGKVSGPGTVFFLKDTGQEALLAARYRLGKYRIEIAEAPFKVGGVEYPHGSWIIQDQAGLGSALADTAKELGLDFVAGASAPDVKRHEATLPRLGIWVPWADTDMIGWIRYILDSQKVPYTYLRDEDIRGGDLKKSVDVIVFGNVLLDLQGQIHGIESKAGPMPFTKTAEFPSLGTPAESQDITGGIGWRGLGNLQEFVQNGGVFITLGAGSTLSLDSGFVRFVRRANLEGVTSPGTELRVKFTQPNHPLSYGYPQITSVLRNNDPIYDPPRRWTTMSYCTSCLTGPWDPRNVVLQWGTKPFDPDERSTDDNSPAILVSGGGRKLDLLEGRPAIFDVPIGKGRVLAFNFNPMHRDMNRSDHRLLWNGIINWNHLSTK